MRPEFWSDALVAALSPGVRLFYIGLWCVADDYGWLRWDSVEIGALLFPYEPAKRRLRNVEAWGQALLDTGRLVLYECGCGAIPTLLRHQVNGGRKTATNRDKHLSGSHSNDRVQVVPKVPDGAVRIVRAVGNVRVSNGRASGTVADEGFAEKLAAAGAKKP